MINIRASMLPSYQDCPRRAAAKQWRKIINDAGYQLRSLQTSIGAIVGTGMHTGAQAMAESVIRTGESLPVSEAIEISITAMRSELSNGAIYDATTKNSNNAEFQTKRLTEAFAIDVLPNIEPERVEVQRVVKINDEFEFSGKTDCEAAGGFIEDYKGGSQYRPAHQQFGGYVILRSSYKESETTTCRMWHLPRTSVNRTYPGTDKYLYDVNQCTAAAWASIQHIMRDMREFLRTGEPWAFACNPMSAICSDKYCPAWGTDFCDMHL